MKKKLRGLALLSKAQRTVIARMGGKAVSKNKAHMKRAGRAGGLATQRKHSATRRALKKSQRNHERTSH